MPNDHNPRWVYTQTIKMFAAPAAPPFEDKAELETHWGRVWGIDNDVGQIRSILVHRPGPEMAVVDPTKRIPEIGSFGDVDEGWYFQSETPPDLPAMQAEHDAMVAALKAAGVEIFHAEGVDGGRLKSCYTRDPLIMVKGGAIVCRMGARIRRGEELATTRTLAKIGVPILRTISGTGVMEGGSFAWINSSTAAIGVGVRVNRDGALQVAEVLKRQGVELLVVELTGYDIHLDVSFLMVDKDLALVNPFGLPHSFMEELKARGVQLVEIDPADDPWINNSLATAPGRLLMPEGASNRTLDALARHGVTWTTIPYAAMHKNGGGIHCSTTPLRRDKVRGLWLGRQPKTPLEYRRASMAGLPKRAVSLGHVADQARQRAPALTQHRAPQSQRHAQAALGGRPLSFLSTWPHHAQSRSWRQERSCLVRTKHTVFRLRVRGQRSGFSTRGRLPKLMLWFSESALRIAQGRSE
jgi:N-dimethylarginine dimethylaminohydrolase